MDLTAWCQILALHNHRARPWEPKMLRLRLFSLLNGSLAMRAETRLHLSRHTIDGVAHHRRSWLSTGNLSLDREDLTIRTIRARGTRQPASLRGPSALPTSGNPTVESAILNPSGRPVSSTTVEANDAP